MLDSGNKLMPMTKNIFIKPVCHEQPWISTETSFTISLHKTPNYFSHGVSLSPTTRLHMYVIRNRFHLLFWRKPWTPSAQESARFKERHCSSLNPGLFITPHLFGSWSFGFTFRPSLIVSCAPKFTEWLMYIIWDSTYGNLSKRTSTPFFQ